MACAQDKRVMMRLFHVVMLPSFFSHLRAWLLGFLMFWPCVGMARNEAGFPSPANAKGLQVQMVPDALALGIHHAAININLTAVLDVAHSKVLAGGPSVFAFNEGYLKALDAQIRPLSEKGIVVYLILIAYPSQAPEVNAVVLYPGHRPDLKFTVGAVNTQSGFFSAVMDKLAERWSGAHAAEHGQVWGWIVGNEANSHWLWNNMGAVSLEQAAGEYEKAVRQAHAAVRKHAANARVYLSFDHHWSVAMHGISAQEAVPGRDFLDTFARVCRERGDFDWHVAWHPYPEDLGNPRAWADAHVTQADDTIKVTFKNLAVLPRHLEKTELLYEGKPRRIILSEQGFHTLANAEGEMLQAAAYAYAWDKVQKLPTVDAFIYHRHVDHSKEGGVRFGLWRNKPGSIADPDKPKLIYDLFKKAGTPEWQNAAQSLRRQAQVPEESD